MKIKNCELYRAELYCDIGEGVIDNKTQPPLGTTREEYALYNLILAVREIARHLDRQQDKKKRKG
jgi:hypothetical protein